MDSLDQCRAGEQFQVGFQADHTAREVFDLLLRGFHGLGLADQMAFLSCGVACTTIRSTAVAKLLRPKCVGGHGQCVYITASRQMRRQVTFSPMG